MFRVPEDFEYELEPLREAADFTVRRGRVRSTQMPILAVSVTAEHPSPQNLRRLEHEFSLAVELDSTWAARPVALARHHGRAVLILEDPCGESLQQVIEQHTRHDMSRVLGIAIGLAAAVGRAHQQGLIHKDLKPANVLVDDCGHVWLTGFGIASRLPHERQVPMPPEIIAGTLAYMAPEQTGRMNRSVDRRCDLYSLGVILYQLVTGVLPFSAADPLEWVHCHIAREPLAPVERCAVPQPLSNLIMRLLSKNAEERYQSAAGLEADLRRCLTEWQSQGRINSFILRANDPSDRLLIPETLYGRERQADALLAAFDRVLTQGTAQLVLVSGYSGVGKSSVVNELHKVLVPRRGLFAAGKFDQYKRDVPYATLAQAFQMLVREILVKSEGEVKRWRHLLLDALGSNGQLMVNLIPEIEFLIGKQPAVAELPPQEARSRFQLVFRRLLCAFARPEHPLALFLDDLQWLDAATLELLPHLIGDSEVRHLLLIGAYRDNEVTPSHPLMQTLNVIRGADVRMLEMVLSPLRLEDVEQFVADTLRCGSESAGSLAHLMYDKTGGNPFFLAQLFGALVDEGLLWFDGVAAAWVWDLDRIRGKRYSGNVVDLMLAKLRRLTDMTQAALQQLACLGNVAEIKTLCMVFDRSEEEIHTSLWDAARDGLILRREDSYAFLHDRIQEAAYALIPATARAEIHLQIGRALLARVTTDSVADFDVANQLNHAAPLLIDRQEKAQVATIDLRAGRRAKRSAAYASARGYFAAGMALLDERDWSTQYELTFALWLERAESEFLTGQFKEAEQLIVELLQRAASKVDQAAVYCLQIPLQARISQNERAVATAIVCLHELGIDIPAHPTNDQVRAEYEVIWEALNGRQIESLIDLPLMSDPKLQAAMRVFSVLYAPAHFSDFNLWCLQACRMVAVSLRHGISADAVPGYAFLGIVLGSVFHRYDEGYRFAKLARDLGEIHGFIASQARVNLATATAAVWTQPVAIAIDFVRASLRAATETGNLASASAGAYQSITYLLLRNDPLDVVWRESEIGLDLVRKGKYHDPADVIVSQQRFIANMQGRTATFSTFSDEHFDEAVFETRLGQDRSPMIACLYWILKLKARFLSGDYGEALAAAGNAKSLLTALGGMIAVLDYFYYAALTVAALYETTSDGDRRAWHDLLAAHREQLREWAVNYPPTFADKYALISAELARVEKRDIEALVLYEEAIDLAHEQGFVQNEGLANQLAAQYYLARNLKGAGYAYLRASRSCYEQWGAHGKVRQLDERHPRLRGARNYAASSATGTSAGQLDFETVAKASQALSSEMALPKLIEKLVRITMEHAGAERTLLILIGDGNDEPRIEAEAAASRGRIEVASRQAIVMPTDLPQSVLHYVLRMRETVLLDDASVDKVYSRDEYIQRKSSKSILCLPILKQTRLIGVLYLENSLTPLAFTADRVAVLQLIAAQAAISLENARLYSDLQLQAELLQRLPVSAWALNPDGTPDFVNQVWLDYSGQTLDFVRSHPEAWMTAIHPEDREATSRVFWDGIRSGQGFAIETRSLRAQDGSYRRHLQQAVVLRDAGGKVLKFIGTTTDVDDQKRVEDALRQAQGDLARINRVTTMGELAASLAHELSQPISGAMTNANTCLRSLERDKPDLDTVRTAVTRIARDAQRASDVIGRIRSQFQGGARHREVIDINEINRETITLLRDEAARYNISVLTELAADLPQIVADRVQLQQVVMNLIVNSIEAMRAVDGIRELVVKSQRSEDGQILVSVSDTGIGFPPQLAEQIFDPFFTTKPQGTGMGLRISRSIIESHGGRLWAVGSPERGAIFNLSLPASG